MRRRWRNLLLPVFGLMWLAGCIIDGDYTHCSYDQNSCINDAGTFKCPAKSEVYGCH